MPRRLEEEGTPPRNTVGVKNGVTVCRFPLASKSLQRKRSLTACRYVKEKPKRVKKEKEDGKVFV